MTTRNKFRGFRITLIMYVVTLAALGCGSSEGLGPDPKPIHDRDFSQSAFISVAGDSALVLVGTSLNGALKPARVYFDAIPSNPGRLHFNFHIVGETWVEDQPAVISSWWSGDTLRVWCAHGDMSELQFGPGYSKTTPKTSWLVPDRVDIAIPTGVGVRFLGNWYENWYEKF